MGSKSEPARNTDALSHGLRIQRKMTNFSVKWRRRSKARAKERAIARDFKRSESPACAMEVKLRELRDKRERKSNGKEAGGRTARRVDDALVAFAQGALQVRPQARL